MRRPEGVRAEGWVDRGGMAKLVGIRVGASARLGNGEGWEDARGRRRRRARRVKFDVRMEARLEAAKFWDEGREGLRGRRVLAQDSASVTTRK